VSEARPSPPFRKVVCIGLDGATFDVIDPLVAQGRLPTLSKLLNNGVRARLMSVVPPLSAPAWVSFMTGTNPGRHGVFHFRAMEEGKLGTDLVGSWAYRGRTIFDLASRAGLSVAAFRVPLTYPPWPLNGVMVSGFPTPEPLRTYSEPPEVGARIGPLLQLSGMRSMIADFDDQVDNFNFYLDRSTEALVELMSGGDFDLFCYVNSITDWIAHKFWRHSDPSAPGYEQRRIHDATPLEYFYERTDASLGALLEAAPQDALIAVLSDHGTGPRSPRRFNTNAWLAEEGLLVRAEGQQMRRLASKGLEWAKDVVPKKYWLWRHSPEVLRRSAGALRAYGGAVQWERSKTYGVRVDHHVDGVNVNLAGREPHGIVPERDYEAVRDEVIATARTVVDPTTGARVLEGAYRREELYDGEHSKLAPDVVLIADPAYEFGIGAERRVFSTVSVGRLGRSSATHRPDGILCLTGKGVRAGSDLGRAGLLDVPATLLWSLGLDVPETFDGRVLTDAFEDEVARAHPVTRVQAGHDDGDVGAYSAEEEEQLASHLQDLGYL
jgi:predicted AlkP superfamily phosphohydrolase/phosphomutase